MKGVKSFPSQSGWEQDLPPSSSSLWGPPVRVPENESEIVSGVFGSRPSPAVPHYKRLGPGGYAVRCFSPGNWAQDVSSTQPSLAQTSHEVAHELPVTW